MANSQTSSPNRPATDEAPLNRSQPEDTLSHAKEADLETLRRLILGDSIEQIINTSLTPEAISRVLPRALARAGYQENELTRALMPTIEDAVKESVQQNEKVLAECLYPVIGPATRKSVGSAIGELVQSLNQTLEYSVSPKSIRWRWEAFRTGKTFAEVVMLRTLVFQVEQVLLIHKETGLLLQHIVDESVESQDPDLVSAMLTAIEDFIQDSFKVESGESLESLELGDLNVWIEEGPHSIVACVVRGSAPIELKELIRASQEKIQKLFGDTLEAFEGDAEALEGSKPYLDDCLHFRFEGQSVDEEKRAPLSDRQKATLWMIALIVTIVIGVHTFLNYQVWQKWNNFVTDLEQQPGLVIISQRKKGSRYILSGLRDPLSVDPDERLAVSKLDPEKVEMTWRPYWSLEPGLTGNRTQALLKMKRKDEDRT